MFTENFSVSSVAHDYNNFPSDYLTWNSAPPPLSNRKQEVNPRGCLSAPSARQTAVQRRVHRQAEPPEEEDDPPPHFKLPLTVVFPLTHSQVWYLSLRPLLQPLQERRNVVVVVNGEFHVLSHNADGNILKGSEPPRYPSTSVSSCPARVPAAGAQPDLGGEVLLSGEGLSERTEAMLDQIVQIT